MFSVRLRPSQEHDQTGGTSRNMPGLPELDGGPTGSGERRARASTTRPVRVQQRSTRPRHLARWEAQPEPSSRRTPLNGIDESDENTTAPTAIPGQPSPQQVAGQVHQGDSATVSEPRRLWDPVGHRSFALAWTEQSHLARDDSFHWQTDWQGATARREQQQAEHSVSCPRPSHFDGLQSEEGTRLHRSNEAQVRYPDGQRPSSPNDQSIRRPPHLLSGVSQSSPRRYGRVMGY